MPDEQFRTWWPFAIDREASLSEDEKAKIAFLEEATRQGFQAFVQQSDCGALSAEGRECYLVWRGRQRSEVLLIDGGSVVVKRIFADLASTSAFRQASAEGLGWLRGLPTVSFAPKAT